MIALRGRTMRMAKAIFEKDVETPFLYLAPIVPP
jgi:hypothetical protein